MNFYIIQSYEYYKRKSWTIKKQSQPDMKHQVGLREKCFNLHIEVYKKI